LAPWIQDRQGLQHDRRAAGVLSAPGDVEAFDAWRKGRENLGEELADIAIYLFGLAQMTGVDLQGEVEAKLAKNAARSYRQLSNGVLVKSDDGRTATG